jgi:hypothetical protein
VCNKKKFVLQEWSNVETSYFIATNMDGNVTREGIYLIPQHLSFTETKNYENHHVTTLELHPISERALEDFNDRTKVTLGEFEKTSGEMAFYGNVFDTDMYAPRFEFEDITTTNGPVAVEWKTETEDKIIQTANNYNENDSDLYSDTEANKKPKAQDISAEMMLFHPPVVTMST